MDYGTLAVLKQQKQVMILQFKQQTSDVLEIAKIVCKNMNLNETKLKTQGGTSDGRGWIGDVTLMLLDNSKLSKLGWKSRFSSHDSVSKSSKELLDEIS